MGGFNLTIFILFTSPELYSKDDIPIIVSWNSWIWYTNDNPFNFASTYWHFAYTRYLFAEGPISEPVVLKVQLFWRFYLSSSNFSVGIFLVIKRKFTYVKCHFSFTKERTITILEYIMCFPCQNQVIDYYYYMKKVWKVFTIKMMKWLVYTLYFFLIIL